ncbi:DUF6653 family protein [Histidinibacterium lentulum]|uniref:Uncharacterized protein n=1 Tax=Histidinibacterium lentulum TaxID=2480588 RepID=A0A3N2QRQ6_9RHOB|nr:DUF6653 family protein [Histidinibacterium lentulum]ROT97705.1 hypothetical protein EAT49_18020 [Histidinibacterium lentulum]
MDIFRLAERLMAMDDATWARHASPWSVWTRAATPLPLLALAIWSRVWIGPWAWLAVALVLLWIWLNPRLFAAPATLDGWAARGVLGERVFLRHPGRIAPHHQRASRTLTALSALGVLPYAWGLWRLDLWAVVAGILLISGAKLWFVDRMAWIWADFTARGGSLAELDTEPPKPETRNSS